MKAASFYDTIRLYIIFIIKARRHMGSRNMSFCASGAIACSLGLGLHLQGQFAVLFRRKVDLLFPHRSENTLRHLPNVEISPVQASSRHMLNIELVNPSHCCGWSAFIASKAYWRHLGSLIVQPVIVIL